VQGSYLRTLRPHLESVPHPYRTLLELMMGQSLARRVVVAPAACEPAQQTESPQPLAEAPAVIPPPLRYRVVDALNARVKRVALVHRIAKRTFQGALRARRLLIALVGTWRSRIRITPSSNGFLGAPKAHRNPDVVRHPGSPRNGQLATRRHGQVDRSHRTSDDPADLGPPRDLSGLPRDRPGPMGAQEECWGRCQEHPDVKTS
jgi:hypothetical protein